MNGSRRGCLEGGPAPEGRGHTAWGFNPRNEPPQTPMEPRRGAGSQRTELSRLRPFGAFGEKGGILPGVETPGSMPAPLRGWLFRLPLGRFEEMFR